LIPVVSAPSKQVAPPYVTVIVTNLDQWSWPGDYKR